MSLPLILLSFFCHSFVVTCRFSFGFCRYLSFLCSNFFFISQPIDEAQEPKEEDTTQTDTPEQKATDLTEDDYDDDDNEEEETEGSEPRPPEPVPPPPESKDEKETQGKL